MQLFRRAVLAALVLCGVAQAEPKHLFELFSYEDAPMAVAPDGSAFVFVADVPSYVPGAAAGRGTLIWNRATGTIKPLSETLAGPNLAPAQSLPVFSTDLRYFAYRVNAADAARLAGAPVANAFGGYLVALTDRDSDADGVMDEPGTVRTLVLPESAYAGPTGIMISGDGRFVVFLHAETYPPYDEIRHRVLLLDRDSDANGAFDEVEGTELRDLGVGSFTAFARDGSTLLLSTDDHGGCGDYVWGAFACAYDVAARTVSRLEAPGLQSVYISGLSGDGKLVLMNAYVNGPNLTQVYSSWFLDRESGSLTDLGPELKAGSTPQEVGSVGASSLSPDGRFLIASVNGVVGGSVLDSGGWSSGPVGIGEAPGMVFVYDRQLGTRTMLQMYDAYERLAGADFGARSLSDDGQTRVGSQLRYTGLAPGQTKRYALLFDLGMDDLRLTVGNAGEAGATRVLRYPITIRNAGATTIKGVVLRAQGALDENADPSTVAGHACTGYNGDTSTYKAQFKCEVGDIAPGATVTGTLVTNPQRTGLAFPLSATLESERTVISYPLAHGTGTGSYSVDLGVTLTLKPPTKIMHVNRALKVMYTVTNMAPGATAMENRYDFRFSLPFKTTATLVNGLRARGCYLGVPGVIQCRMPSLKAGFMVSSYFNVTPTTIGTLTVTMTRADADSYEVDRNPANNSATKVLPIAR